MQRESRDTVISGPFIAIGMVYRYRDTYPIFGLMVAIVQKSTDVFVSGLFMAIGMVYDRNAFQAV